ncbi:MAG: hypothetical protein HY075_08050 [Deltaproteobacteria bacterium]|nr:hypothetical protein [Deltaproteobacteria bacterium]
MRNAFATRLALSVLTLSLVSAPGCALLKKNADSGGGDDEAVVADTVASSVPAHQPDETAILKPLATLHADPAQAAAAPAAVAAQVETLEGARLERTDLKAIKKLSIRLSHAEVQLSGAGESRKTRFKIDQAPAGTDCRVRVRIDSTNGALEIAEATPVPGHAMSAVSKGKSSVPSASRCRFVLQLETREPMPAVVEVTRGSILAESWPQSLTLKLDWGDVDVGAVGPLDVTCGHCMFSGEGIAGPLHYNLESGNVGLAGLGGSVVGQTLGDTVLKWQRLRADSNVKLVSHAGDVILFFPESSPLAIDLHAPRGDVNSRFETGGRGVPVSVTAELGNVQVYRAGKGGGGH